ncbi:glycosyltransferase [Ligilactobacillus salivarius]|uniref:Glycosyltransferase n=2 Tax=Ligilactobacillus salivarius TaxID=1624 RepID=V6DPB0_9LACO|nr:glycosyltransferase [Ligilactobacillus salivarius]CDK35865.1 Glycosyltransferase [Ligilactobacillus salivarius cp400]PAY26076.1 hypothetical protein A8C33_08960 [Ligilactobacillus salivarius]PAY28618.1 hypothetical protein A8C49_08385 [Ligilactobacillus salivarius]PAY30038.1 hypothetical protein A8C44_09200 [Ligilactobacillus salivarius]PAY33106.1 hypothetical protein A8C35_08320 [Ligilactobacillus salivarius]
MPIISVIMGVYNCDNNSELIESIKSILNQSFKDLELIICDDGSTDDTYDRLLEISKIDSRIRIIGYKENKGLAYALNECIKVSRGKYIARQDSDDISLSDRLEKELRIIENKNVDIVGTCAVVFNKNGEWGHYNVPEYPEKKDFLWNNPFIHPTVLMKKSSLQKVNGYLNTKINRRCEDYDLFMRMYANGFRGVNIAEYLYKYKIDEGKKKKRPMKYRIDEMRVRYKGFKELNMLKISSLFFVVKPIVIGLIPQFIFKKIRGNNYKKRK